jgi:hypothetical protein
MEMTLKHFQVIILFILRLVEYIKLLLTHKSAVLSGIRLDILTPVKIHVLIFFGYVYLLYWNMWGSLQILLLSSATKMEVEHISQTLQPIYQPITQCHEPEDHTTLMDNCESTVI